MVSIKTHLPEDQARLQAVHDELLAILHREGIANHYTHLCVIDIDDSFDDVVALILSTRQGKSIYYTAPRYIPRQDVPKLTPQLFELLLSHRETGFVTFVIQQCDNFGNCVTNNPNAPRAFKFGSTTHPDQSALDLPFEYTQDIHERLNEGGTRKEIAFRVGVCCATISKNTGISPRTVFDIAVCELSSRNMLTAEQKTFCFDLIADLWAMS